MLEICIDSVKSGLIAQQAGASRVELCCNLAEGGTTPSPAQIKFARECLHIALHVLIRPRGGDFLYDDLEFEQIKSDIIFCGEAGCDGIVIGMLNPDGTIDRVRCAELIATARYYKMNVTFHRAFDHCRDLFRSMEDIIELGCERILTSGGKNSAFDGRDTIKALIEKANQRIIIMPGAGITPENIGGIVTSTRANEIHGTFRSPLSSKMQYYHTDIEKEKLEYIADFQKIKIAGDILRTTIK